MLFHGAGNSGNEPTATNRNNDGLDIGDLLKDFEAHRSLTGDDVGVVKGWNENSTRLFGELLRRRERFSERRAEKHDLGTVILRRQQFRQSNTHRHENRRLDAKFVSCEGDALSMVSRAGRNDAAGPFVGAQLAHAVVRATNLVSARPLQVFTLENNLNAQNSREIP
ncbi:unannotated protein [freshwater metagenome]|uniref:Unannotated protein n=1 Tax=freshwater metagenome TaxID=449393 RepID=A0A6J7DQX1_9ZZZZ